MLQKVYTLKLIILAVASLVIISCSTLSPIENNTLEAVGLCEANIKSYDNFGTHESDGFLWTILQIETSGGINLNHKTITYGKYRGQKAIGRWGLLKPTIDELIKRRKRDGLLTPEVAQLKNLSRDQVEMIFKDKPQVELDLARQLVAIIKLKQKGNLKKMAYSWLNGHNLTHDKVDKDDLKESDYVAKFLKISKKSPYKRVAIREK